MCAYNNEEEQRDLSTIEKKLYTYLQNKHSTVVLQKKTTASKRKSKLLRLLSPKIATMMEKNPINIFQWYKSTIVTDSGIVTEVETCSSWCRPGKTGSCMYLMSIAQTIHDRLPNPALCT